MTTEDWIAPPPVLGAEGSRGNGGPRETEARSVAARGAVVWVERTASSTRLLSKCVPVTAPSQMATGGRETLSRLDEEEAEEE